MENKQQEADNRNIDFILQITGTKESYQLNCVMIPPVGSVLTVKQRSFIVQTVIYNFDEGGILVMASEMGIKSNLKTPKIIH